MDDKQRRYHLLRQIDLPYRFDCLLFFETGDMSDALANYLNTDLFGQSVIDQWIDLQMTELLEVKKFHAEWKPTSNALTGLYFSRPRVSEFLKKADPRWIPDLVQFFDEGETSAECRDAFRDHPEWEIAFEEYARRCSALWNRLSGQKGDTHA